MSTRTKADSRERELDALRVRVAELEAQMAVCLRWMNRKAQQELRARGLGSPVRLPPEA